ncbi:rifampicin phosphotransferase-like isoform X2 [Tachypleus tridentatus]
MACHKNHLAEVWLILHLPNGEVLTIPNYPDCRVLTVHQGSYTASGLKMTCLSAMRKWRITFNGLLRKMNTSPPEDGDHDLVHVKFSFIWTNMYGVYDFRQELRSRLLVRKKSLNLLSAVQSINQCLQFYEQWGYMTGTLHIEGQDEKEMNLWGFKSKNIDNKIPSDLVEYLQIYGYLKEGSSFHLGKNVFASSFSTHGYIMTSAEHLLPADASALSNFSLENNKTIAFTGGKKEYKLKIRNSNQKFDIFNGVEGRWAVTIHLINLEINGEPGWGFVLLHNKLKRTLKQVDIPPEFPLVDQESEISIHSPLVVSLENHLCCNSKLVGGKGMSLALLTKLSKKSPKFSVPLGIVVTVAAYQSHLAGHVELQKAIENLLMINSGKAEGSLENECVRVAELVKSSSLSQILRDTVKEEMLTTFGDQLESLKFAIRSSAVGEDSEEMSAAGQMETILGVQGLNQVFEALTQCWASQFTFQAVQYKRQNGQPVDTEMGVVIQEMVPSKAAGVMFTHDPVTGNPALICITGNYGLGESVVSAAAEPDTFVVFRSCNKELSILKNEIGEKKLQIQMKVGGGTEEKIVPQDEANKCCLSESEVLQLGYIGVLVEEASGGPRDIEWATSNGKFYLLQARPITSFDTETEFELTHEFDTAVYSVYDYYTTANTGEVCPGPLTPLSISIVTTILDISIQMNFLARETEKKEDQYNPLRKMVLALSHQCLMMNMMNCFLRNNDEKVSEVTSCALEIGVFGHVIIDENMHQRGIQRFGVCSRWFRLKRLLYVMVDTPKVRRKITILEEHFSKYSLKPETFFDAKELYQYILSRVPDIVEPANLHMQTTTLNSFYNVTLLIVLLSKQKGMTPDTYADIAMLLGSCGELESADVPAALQDLTHSIMGTTNWEEFCKMTPQDAVKWLTFNTGTAGKKFQEFIQKHGHRCVKEFELFMETWGMKPENIINILQSMKEESPSNQPLKQNLTTEETVGRLKMPLGRSQRWFLKYLLPKCHEAVANREKSKSLLIRTLHAFRLAFCQLGSLMLREGRLPEEDLIFFLTLEEIGTLLYTRSARLLAKAIRRKRLFPKLQKLELPEIMNGIPRPVTEEYEEVQGSVVIKGTPVSQGIIKSTARVIIQLEDAITIKPGDILITRSTDIGWSPYFPLLAGIVTELGGLISHGAVVAREYGLPCLVGVKRATSLLKSGDTVILDGSKGFLKKVD